MDTVISFKNVSKKYRIGQSRYNSLREDISNSFRKIFNFNKGSEDKNFIWALKDVSFEVKKGESLGIIGPNGAGKTTILKLLSRITLPTEGLVSAQGKLSALIELGAGLHPELSGRENIYLYGSIMGMKRRVIEKRFDEIVDFSGLRQFIDTPVKRYSSGMYVRLSFAVAVLAEPEILLVDEVLAVGDVYFQQKCLQKIKELREKGCTVIFITHNMSLLPYYSDRVLFINRGSIVSDGLPEKVISDYFKLYNLAALASGKDSKEKQSLNTAELLDWRGFFKLNDNERRFGNLKAEIIEAGIFDSQGNPAQTVCHNEEFTIKLKIKFNQNLLNTVVAYTIKSMNELDISGTNTFLKNIDLGNRKKGDIIIVEFNQRMYLNEGSYLLNLGCVNTGGGEIEVYDRRYNYLIFEVKDPIPSVGVVDLQPSIKWSIVKENANI